MLQIAQKGLQGRPRSGKEKLELLLVKDNEEMREYIRYCIGETKHNITEAGDGETGIEKAQALLREGQLSVSKVAYRAGFSSVSHSSWPFKQAFGKAPSEM